MRSTVCKAKLGCDAGHRIMKHRAQSREQKRRRVRGDRVISKRPKITVVGSGNVGSTVAQYVARRELGDVVLTDILEGVAAGKALDMQESAPLDGFDSQLQGTVDYDLTDRSDIVVITAGSGRKPGMNRDDLAQSNAKVVRQVVREIVVRSPDAQLILVTNPCDVMSYVAYRESGFPAERVIGLGGVLDSSRFRAFIALELDVSMEDVSALVLGGHGDEMVPLPRYSYVSGIPIETLLDRQKIDRIIERTRHGGTEIVRHLTIGGAYYAPGSSILQMIEAIVKDRRRILPCSAYVTGQYGVHDLFLGVPVLLGGHGAERIVELELTKEEQAALHRSADNIRRVIGQLS